MIYNSSGQKIRRSIGFVTSYVREFDDETSLHLVGYELDGEDNSDEEDDYENIDNEKIPVNRTKVSKSRVR